MLHSWTVVGHPLGIPLTVRLRVVTRFAAVTLSRNEHASPTVSFVSRQMHDSQRYGDRPLLPSRNAWLWGMVSSGGR